MTVRWPAQPPLAGWRLLSKTIAVPAILLAATCASINYVLVYCAFGAMCLAQTILVNRYARPLFAIVGAYLLIAMPNISTWRGSIAPYTVKMYAVCLFALYVPLTTLPRRLRFRVATTRFGTLARIVVVGHLLISWGAVAYLYAVNGIILLQQDLRYSVPASLEYVVKSPLALAAFCPFFVRRRWMQLVVVGAVVAPAILIGSHGTALVSVLSYGMCRRYWQDPQESVRRVSRRSTLVALVVVGISIISVGFYVRRRAGAQLAPAPEIARVYFESDSWWVLAVMPLHLGFRETVGLSNRIIMDDIRNERSDHTLFFADLYTVLPGEQLSAGQSLSQLFGNVEAGGLTPGLVGGLYIDYGEVCVVVFALCGVALAWFMRRALTNYRFVPLYCVFLTQLLHLFHRGLLKPEYLTVMVISGVYAVLLRRANLRVTQPADAVPRIVAATANSSACGCD